MSDSAESVVRNFLAAWKRSDVDEIVSFISDDAVYIGPRGVHHGIGAIKALIQSFVKVTPSTIVDVKTLVATGGTVMVERVDNFDVQGKPFGLEVAAVFEVDSAFPPGKSGWSVMAKGWLTREHGEKRSAALRSRLTAWAQGERDVVLHLAVEELTGRAVGRP